MSWRTILFNNFKTKRVFLQNKIDNFNWPRLIKFETVIYFGFIIILARAFVIQMFPPSEKSLSKIAMKQYHKPIKIGNYRGKILDRRKEPLAMSVKAPSLAVNPRMFKPSRKDIFRISKILKIPRKKIKDISRRTNYFSWLKRKISNNQSHKVLSLEIPGVYKINEPSRFYPIANAGSHLIGKVDSENKGILGLELALNKVITGDPGQINAVKDGKGQLIFQNSESVAPELPGHDILLTIDKVIQTLTAKELENGVQNASAKAGFALVGNPHTGEIYAMASYPNYNPNHGFDIKIQDTKNKATADIFEPGSVVKPFVIGKALENRLIDLNTVLNCEKSGVYRFGRYKIRDDHPKEHLTPSEVLVHSSNICTFKIAKLIGKKGLYTLYRDLNFSEKPKFLQLIGSSRGRLADYKTWTELRFANISFGQGHAVNGIDLLRGYNAIANGGNLVEPYVIDKIVSAAGKVIEQKSGAQTTKIFSPEISAKLRGILQQVVLNGTATHAQSNLYTVAGKTGTSEKYDPALKGYSPTKRLASFAGFAPYNDPKLTVIVVIDEPGKTPYYGGKWAAPVFKNIIDGALKYLNVAPDKSHVSKARLVPKEG